MAAALRQCHSAQIARSEGPRSKINGLTVSIDRAVEVSPSTSDLDVGFDYALIDGCRSFLGLGICGDKR